MKINWFNLIAYTIMFAISIGFWYTFIVMVLYFINR